MQKVIKGFASDNNSGVHPEILKAISSVNIGHTHAYGNDNYTELAIQKFKEHFGENIDVYFVFTGTAANVLSYKTITNSFNSIICSEDAHTNIHECASPENYTGCKLLTIPTKDGKINVEQIKKYMRGVDDEHFAQPKVISITQSTEFGTVYALEEIKSISDFAHNHNMLLFMDGARLANAAVSLDVTLKEMTNDVGVDVLSFGGTKNGALCAESIVFFNRDKELSSNFKYIRKQGMQLFSKMRFISIQFDALFTNDLWKKNAKHSNDMASLLAKEIEKISQIKITQKVEANSIFAMIPSKYIRILQEEFYFYIWNEGKKESEVRLVMSFDITKEDVMNFVDLLKRILF